MKKTSKEVLKKIGLILLAVIVIFAVIAAFQPNEFRAERSIAIKASPAAIFPHLTDLRKGQAWSPWAKMDPDAKYTFEGPARGVGAKLSWVGNNDIGAGSMTEIESKPNQSVKFDLEFIRPMPGKNTAEYTLKRENGETVVTWTMYGPCNYACKAMGLLFNCKKMVEEQFDQGLASLKSLVETGKP